MTKATGLKASTLFFAFEKLASDEHEAHANFREHPGNTEVQWTAHKKLRQLTYIGGKLKEKLEAQEKELEELRYTNGQLEIEISILNSVVK